MNNVYEANRLEIINSMKEDSVVVLFSGHSIKSSADGEFPFVVNRNFYHLTGINEPNLILVFSKEETTLYIEESDQMFEKWIGKKISADEARLKSNIQNIKYVEQFNEVSYSNNQNLYLDLEADQISHFPTLAEKFKMEKDLRALDVYPLIAHSRSIKSDLEVNKIKEALSITEAGLNNVLAHMKPNMKESVYEAYFDFVLKSENVIHAFDTIAASGNNATTLHYVTNNEIAKDGDLVLFDLGATKDLYCADISRTYPANGKFTKRQKDLYEMVLKANELVIDAIKPGVTMNDLNNIVIEWYETELVRLNVITPTTTVKDYYYHGVSHSLGLDTHDIGLDRDTPLRPGHVITVEPGIYINEEGIGIRIEDNILVTETGNINLSESIIKSVKDIEEYMQRVQKA